MSSTAAATACVRRSQFIPIPGGPLVAVQVTQGQVLSVQQDGSFGLRPIDKIGPWETGRDSGDKLIFSDGAYPTGEFAVLIDNNG